MPFLLCLLFLIGLSACTDEQQPELKPLSPDSTILAFGDSLTFGTGARNDESYPAILEKLIEIKVINAGIPGETTPEARKRLGRLLKRFRPDLVILCHGGNDLLRKMDQSQTIENLKAMISQIKKSGTQVLLLSVPTPGLLLKPATFYQKVAHEMHIPIATGILSRILSNHQLKSDAVHPNGKGYFEMAHAIAEILLNMRAIDNVSQ